MERAVSSVGAGLAARCRSTAKRATGACLDRLDPVLRRRAIHRGFPSDGRVTVVIVNWNSLPYLAVALHAVRAMSPAGTAISVVDNGSRDGSRRALLRARDVSCTLLPFNAGHGAALDVGFLRAHTEFVVAMDVDAFPLSIHWLDRLVDPLGEGAVVSGVCTNRPYAHPCGMAMRRQRFVCRNHSFKANLKGGPAASLTWDSGEAISRKEWPAVHLIERTESDGPGWVGTRWEDVLYHNFYATRMGGDTVIRDGKISRSGVEDAWQRNVGKYVGVNAEDWPALLHEL